MPGKHNAGQWAELEQALAQNLTRTIGISNFNSEQIEELMKTAGACADCRGTLVWIQLTLTHTTYLISTSNLVIDVILYVEMEMNRSLLSALEGGPCSSGTGCRALGFRVGSKPVIHAVVPDAVGGWGRRGSPGLSSPTKYQSHTARARTRTLAAAGQGQASGESVRYGRWTGAGWLGLIFSRQT